MTENLNLNFLQYILKLIPNYIIFSYMEKTELTLFINYLSLYFMMLFCKKHTNMQLNCISDITAVDYPGKFLRFEIFYNCFSIKYNYRLRIKTILNELLALISVNKLFLSSSWWEREIWDMFGIFFYEHSRLRRILTDYGFIGYPLRKDFPCVGFYEVRYSEADQKVIYEPLEFSCYTRFS